MAKLAGTPKLPSGHSALATNPDYEITVEAEPKRMRVVFNGETIADSNKTALLHETRLPDTHYFPRQDVAMDFLNSTDHHTFAPIREMHRTGALWPAARPWRTAPGVINSPIRKSRTSRVISPFIWTAGAPCSSDFMSAPSLSSNFIRNSTPFSAICCARTRKAVWC